MQTQIGERLASGVSHYVTDIPEWAVNYLWLFGVLTAIWALGCFFAWYYDKQDGAS